MVGKIGEDLSNYLYLRLLRPNKSSPNLPLSGEEDSKDSTDPGAFRADFGGIFPLAEEDWGRFGEDLQPRKQQGRELLTARGLGALRIGAVERSGLALPDIGFRLRPTRQRAFTAFELPAPVAGHHLGPFAIGAPRLLVLLVHDEFAKQWWMPPAHARKAIIAILGNTMP